MLKYEFKNNVNIINKCKFLFRRNTKLSIKDEYNKSIIKQNVHLLNFTSQVPLWITSGITLLICLLYILRGGFTLSIITDKYQFTFIILII